MPSPTSLRPRAFNRCEDGAPRSQPSRQAAAAARCGDIVTGAAVPEERRPLPCSLGDASLEGVSSIREQMMTKLKMIGAIGALLLGTSTLVLAQTNSTGTNSTGTGSG